MNQEAALGLRAGFVKLYEARSRAATTLRLALEAARETCRSERDDGKAAIAVAFTLRGGLERALDVLDEAQGSADVRAAMRAMADLDTAT